jgi:1,4-dihydroxy-2-naphthoate octaprenyltransferase
LLALTLALGLAYSLPPQLSWRGLGEVTNAVLGGIVLPLYGMATLGYSPGILDVATFLPFALVVFANLLATQWPDRRADATVGKRTLAVRLSSGTLRTLHGTISFVGLLSLLVLVAADGAPLVLPILALPTFGLLADATRRYGVVESPARSVHAMVLFAFAYVLAAGCGWW